MRSVYTNNSRHGERVWCDASARSRWVVGLVLCLLLSACAGRPASSKSADVYFTFLDHFSEVRVDPKPSDPNDPNVRLYPFVRDRVRRLSLVTVADARARFTVPEIPASAELRGYIGMPFNLGDGALAELLLVQEGHEHRLLSRYVDPAHRSEDRVWIPIHVDLTPFAGRPAEIIFSARATTGDYTADWMGWAEPVIARRR